MACKGKMPKMLYARREGSIRNGQGKDSVGGRLEERKADRARQKHHSNQKEFEGTRKHSGKENRKKRKNHIEEGRKKQRIARTNLSIKMCAEHFTVTAEGKPNARGLENEEG